MFRHAIKLPTSTVVIQKDSISVLCLQSFKKCYPVGSERRLLYNSICQNTHKVSAWPWRRRHYGPSGRREFHLVACQKVRIFQQHRWEHVKYYVTVDSQVYRYSSLIRDCSKKVGFWDLSNVVSFRAIWEIIFSVASLRCQGLSDFQCWRTHLGAWFLNRLNYSPSGDWHPSKSHLRIYFLPDSKHSPNGNIVHENSPCLCSQSYEAHKHSRWENCRASCCNSRWYV